ncbi:MAG: hypothetical protein PHT43_00665 [Anaerolineaceae bacterium]|nr:hypothetical protein [Anaerolineaceae bacterium]
MRFVIPARKQPKIIDAFKAGYETLSRHLYLLLFPILLDIFFLFGKRYLISEQIEGFVKSIVLPNSATTEILESWQELSSSLVETVQHFSLTSFLRTYPIGTPSLLAHRNLTENPLTAFSTSQVTSPWTTILLVILFSLIGFVYGALFLLVIRNAVVGKKETVQKQSLVKDLASLFMIPIVSIIAFIIILLPALLIVSLLNALLPLFGSLGYFFLTFMLISSVIPMIFTPHHILLYGEKFPKSLKESILTVKPTNAKTSFFILFGYFATFLTDYLWQIPQDNSWMLLVSILGHSLVTTIIFAASFHYYIDARKSVRESQQFEVPDFGQTS